MLILIEEDKDVQSIVLDYYFPYKPQIHIPLSLSNIICHSGIKLGYITTLKHSVNIKPKPDTTVNQDFIYFPLNWHRNKAVLFLYNGNYHLSAKYSILQNARGMNTK